MMIKRILFLSLILSISLLSQGQKTKIDFEEYDLDNGLHVILHEDNSSPIVAITVLYHVGSKNEKPTRTGFAHFFEHLMFEGTKNIARGEYSKIVDRAGGDLNANTSWDRTYYYEILSSNQLELGLWLESERMLHLNVDSIGVITQKKVVCEEIKQREENQPYGSILRETQKRAFLEHPYRTTILGSGDHIMAAEDQDFKDFYDMFYVPNNAVLTIAGDIDIDEAKKLVDKYFSGIPKRTEPINRPTAVEPIKHKEIRDTVYDNIQLPAVIQAYHTPESGSEDSYAVDMLSTLLSGGQSSRFTKVLVDEKQLALEAFSFPVPFEDAGFALTFALPNMGIDPMELETAMNAEVKRLHTELVSDEELQKLKNQFEAQAINGNASLEGRAETLATNYAYHGNTNLINTELEKYLNVTKEDIMRVAKKYFREDNRVVLYYLPKSQQ